MFQRFFDDGLAQASYMAGCERTRKAFVVDPRRDVSIYVEAARRHGLLLEYAIETHIHADFVSGARELSALGVQTLAGPGSSLGFPHREVTDGERIQVGDLRLTFLHTPGHTPEHISILLEEIGDAPPRLFTGDTLFVGGVGRPDLLGEDQTRALAADLHASLFDRILTLPGGTEVHPGHGAGSLCGAGIGSEPSSTIEKERRTNAMLQHRSRDEFVAAVLADLPDTPPYFSRMKRINKAGPPVLGLGSGAPDVPAITAADAAAAVAGGAWLIDLRPADAFGAGHPKGALNIGFGQKVGYWAGWVIPADVPLVLIGPAAAKAQAQSAAGQLRAVGLDTTIGYVDGGVEAWLQAGLPTASVPQISVRELRDRMERREGITLVDVRTPKEWTGGHLETATHIPVGTVASKQADLPSEGPVLTLCEGGYRSSLAASLLLRAGRTDVVNVTGGMAAYRQMETAS